MNTSEAGRKGGLARADRWKGTAKAAAISRKGGKARAKKLDPARRREIAKAGGEAMWAKRRAAVVVEAKKNRKVGGRVTRLEPKPRTK
jgi:general stress protein YciG